MMLCIYQKTHILRENRNLRSWGITTNSTDAAHTACYIYIQSDKPLTGIKIFQIDDEAVKKCYTCSDNYRIEYQNKESNYVAIYFSSHGIYFPNEISSFERSILRRNRYEWTKNSIVRAGKHIFVRDIYKQWYLEGINKELNSIESLLEFLKHETKGKKVITIGSSAGGYAAMLFGVLLNAETIYSFSGQISLQHVLKKSTPDVNPLVFKYRDDPQVNRYYDLTDIIRHSGSRIFHFYCSMVEEDCIQYGHCAGLDNVTAFQFNSKRHGVPCYVVNIGELTEKNNSELLEIANCYRNRKINKLLFSLRISGVMGTTSALIYFCRRVILKCADAICYTRPYRKFISLFQKRLIQTGT